MKLLLQHKWAVTVAVIAAIAIVVSGRFGGRDLAPPAPTSTAPAGAYTVDSLLSVSRAAEAAQNFVRLWALPLPGDTTETWEERLDGLVTHDLGRGLQVTDLGNLPRLGLSKATPPDVRAVSTRSATVVVTLEDGSEIACEVVIYGPGYAVGSFAGIDGD
ncbi:hypothetical protein JCM9957A_50200 [Kineosporia succinea]